MPEINFHDVQVNLPKCLALLHVGATAYCYRAFIDPKFRKCTNLRERVHHWADSTSLTHKILGGASLAVCAATLNTWRITKDNNWLIGGAVVAAIVPFHMLFLSKEKEVLSEDERKGKIELDLDKREVLCNNLSSWSCKFSVKLILSAIAAGVFFYVDQKANNGDGSKQLAKSA